MFDRWRFSFLGLALLASAAPAFSFDGTVTVNGEVLLETCTVNGGVPTFGVILPTLSTSALAAVGSTAGATRFAIALTNCEGLAEFVNAYFENGPSTNAEGRLINQTAGGASVDGQIKNADGSVVNLAAPFGSQNTLRTPIVGQSATQMYFIAYFANAMPVNAGAFSSSVVYTLMYQ
jgi:major type 1 subunit fimbrin (pilin)